MHRTDSSFRRHPGGGSLRRFSFRRKPTRESIPEPTSTWSFNDESHEWQLLRGNIRFIHFLFIINREIYLYMRFYLCYYYYLSFYILSIYHSRTSSFTSFISVSFYTCTSNSFEHVSGTL